MSGTVDRITTIACQNIDRITTVEMRRSNYSRGVIAHLHAAACSALLSCASSRSMRAWIRAPAHIGQGSRVTSRVQSGNRQVFRAAAAWPASHSPASACS